MAATREDQQMLSSSGRQQEIQPGDIIRVDARRKATFRRWVYDESAGITGALVAVWTDGESEEIEVALHRISPA